MTTLPLSQEPDRFTTHLKTIITAVIIIISTILGLGFIYYTRDILMLLFIAYIVSVGVRNIVNPFQAKTKWPRSVCAAIAYIVLVLIIIGLIAVIVPSLATQVVELVKQFDLGEISTFIQNLSINLNDLNSFVQQIANFGQPLISGISSAFGSFVSIFTMIILSFHLVVTQGQTKKYIQAFTRRSDFAETIQGFSDLLKKQLGGWIQGELILMFVVGLVSYLAFLLIGLPYALPLAILAGSLELIPTIGPIISAIPAVLLGFTVSPLAALLALIVCVVIQQLENVFLVPKVMNRSANINPIVSIVAILMGFKLLGAMGALVALPAYIILRCIYFYFVRDRHFYDFSKPAPSTPTTKVEK